MSKILFYLMVSFLVSLSAILVRSPLISSIFSPSKLFIYLNGEVSVFGPKKSCLIYEILRGSCLNAEMSVLDRNGIKIK